MGGLGHVRLGCYNELLSLRVAVMPTAFLEIIELPDGRIALRRAEDKEPLVTLEFSVDARAFLQGQQVEVAKAMLNVGVQMAGRLAEGESLSDEGSRVLH